MSPAPGPGTKLGTPWWQYCQKGCGGPGDAWEPWSAKALWRENEDELLEEWFATRGAGHRPDCWWRYSAPRAPLGRYQGKWYDAGQYPELRRRLSGTGTPKFEVLAYVPTFWLGVPDDWLEAQDLKTWPALQAEAYDPSDPPVYEAQASYLERHGLLLPGERRKLRKKDFEPQVVAL